MTTAAMCMDSIGLLADPKSTPSHGEQSTPEGDSHKILPGCTHLNLHLRLLSFAILLLITSGLVATGQVCLAWRSSVARTVRCTLQDNELLEFLTTFVGPRAPKPGLGH